MCFVVFSFFFCMLACDLGSVAKIFLRFIKIYRDIVLAILFASGLITFQIIVLFVHMKNETPSFFQNRLPLKPNQRMLEIVHSNVLFVRDISVISRKKNFSQLKQTQTSQMAQTVVVVENHDNDFIFSLVIFIIGW